MKKFLLITTLVFLCGFFALAAAGDEAEEIDFLLFFPNSSNRFMNEEQANIQLDILAKYLLERNLSPGQIIVFGYAAVADNDIEPFGFSRERALFVMQELQKRGVPASLFSEPVGHGSVNTWGSNANEEDKIPNRRVRILVEDTFLTPSMMNTADAAAPVPVITREEVIFEEVSDKSSFKFPWGILLLLLLILLLLALLLFLLKRKKTPAIKKPGDPIPAEEPLPPLPPAPPSPPLPPAPSEPEPVPVIAVVPPPPAAAREIVVDLEEEIRFRAYELYLERGCLDGYRDEDWHTAVFQVCTRYEAAGYFTNYEELRWKAFKTENC